MRDKSFRNRAWRGFLLLSLPAYLAGAWLALRYKPDASLGITIDRRQAISTAVRYAQSLGYQMNGTNGANSWQGYVTCKTDNTLFFYYSNNEGEPLVRRLAPALTIPVRLRSNENDQAIEVVLDSQGQVLGYSHFVNRDYEVPETTEEASRAVALEAIRRRLAGSGISPPSELSPGEPVRGQPRTRIYRWRWPLRESTQLTVISEVAVRGGRLAGDSIRTTVDERVDGRSETVASRLWRWRKKIIQTLCGLLLGALILFGIFRFVQRVREKEVSAGRSLILALLSAAIMSLFVLTTDDALFDSVTELRPGPPLWLISIVMSTFFLIPSLLLGLAYGSGEGDLREPYPGKLASLDALLTGRLASRNVALSLIIGCAIGGWLFLTQNLWLLFSRIFQSGQMGISELQHWFGRAPWLSVFFGWVFGTVLIVVPGLLIPLPLFHRRFRSHRTTILLTWITVMIAVIAMFPVDFRPWEGLLLTAIPLAALILLAFLGGDLLTAFVAIGSSQVIGEIISLVAQPSSTLRVEGFVALGAAITLVATGLAVAFNGKLYREDDVRPVYAGRLAERLRLQSEVTAAREAQLRLMPRESPRLPGITVAALCQPAFEVGGDYYDFMPLDDGRLAILVAEGGAQRLAAALSIAYAKGFLLPGLSPGPPGSPLANRDISPVQLLRELHDHLTMRIGADHNIRFLLLLVDPDDRSVAYTRTGESPRLLTASTPPAGQVWGSAPLTRPPEEISEYRHLYHDRETSLRLVEGRLNLTPERTLFIVTDCIAAQLEASPDLLAGVTAADLHLTLTSLVARISRQTKRLAIDDDLTIVALQPEN